VVTLMLVVLMMSGEVYQVSNAPPSACSFPSWHFHEVRHRPRQPLSPFRPDPRTTN